MINEKKIVIFGAGKIGRSFIGQLFSKGGYEVVFIDVYKPIIDELNRRREYEVIVKSEHEEILKITHVRGVFAGNTQEVIIELATAGIAAVSIGLNGLKDVFPVIAQGISQRFQLFDLEPLDIIIAENTRNAEVLFFEEIKKHLSAKFPLEHMLGLIETSIGKMVPIMQKKDTDEDMLRIFAEPYNTLILNAKAFKNPIPKFEGLAPKENIKAWVDRKLFIHNLGHAAAAYIGYYKNPNQIFLYEVLKDPEVLENTREVMLQAAEILLAKYPGEFTREALIEHIEDLLNRFQNKFLGDTVFRVGCDLMRKLGPEDRVVGAIKEAIRHNLPHDRIDQVLIKACHFRAVDENGKMLDSDLEFAAIYSRGITKVLNEVCLFSENQVYTILINDN